MQSPRRQLHPRAWTIDHDRLAWRRLRSAQRRATRSDCSRLFLARVRAACLTPLFPPSALRHSAPLLPRPAEKPSPPPTPTLTQTNQPWLRNSQAHPPSQMQPPPPPLPPPAAPAAPPTATATVRRWIWTRRTAACSAWGARWPRCNPNRSRSSRARYSADTESARRWDCTSAGSDWT